MKDLPNLMRPVYRVEHDKGLIVGVTMQGRGRWGSSILKYATRGGRYFERGMLTTPVNWMNSTRKLQGKE